MLTKHRGYPLWIPECSLNLPVEKQKEGIAIGDVGLITSSGGFSFLFNITLAADHPFQPTEMPDGFKPIPAPKPRDIRVFNELKPYTSLTSVSVEEVHPENTMESGEHVFQSSPAEGAILTLPNGATTLDLEARGIWRGYMAKHIESWYKYVNGVLGLLGCDKASFWGMAAVSGQAHNPQGHELRFRPVKGRRAKVRHVWTCTGVVDTRTGPTVSELQKLGIGGEAEQNNQCLFIRTMNGMMGEEQWEKLNKEIAAILLPDEFPSTAPGPSGSSSSSTLSTTTTTMTTPASSSSSELSVADALNFLDSIQDRLGRDSGIYDGFLTIMKDSRKNDDIIRDRDTVIRKVAILFYETAPDLLQAFNKFIPSGYQVYPYIYPRASNNVAIETPQGTFVLNTVTGEVHQAPDLAIEGPSDNLSIDGFVAAVKVRLRGDPSTYHQFINILGRSQQTTTSDLTSFDKSDLVRQLSPVFQNHQDLLQGANAAIGTPGYQLRLICHPRPCNKLLVVTPDTSSFILDVNTGRNLGPPSVDLCYTNTHPGDVLNHFLLQESPTSRAVITTDDDWIWSSLLDQGSSFEFPTDETLLGSILLSRRIRLYNDVVMLDPHQAPEPEQAKVTPTHQLEILDRDAQERGRHLTNSSSASLHLYLVPALDALRFFHRTIPGYDRATDDTWSEEIYSTPVVQRFIEVLDSWMINDNQKLIRSKVGSSSGEDSTIISSVKSLLHQKGTQAPAFIDRVSAEEAVRGFASRLALPFRPVIEFYLRYRLFGSTASLEKCVDGLKSIVDFNMSGTPQRLLSDDEFPLIVSDQASSTPSSVSPMFSARLQ
ncbi:hypothetical protein BJ165DRAFT_1463513 [Panaeolus papilionaceus]|nr:hypothetical protein BJ165DRAFT_1463513 [Panaeolus papilionaceus]